MSEQTAAHGHAEDLVALVLGTFLISFGVYLFNSTMLLTGGTAGVSFLINYLTGIRFGIVFFVINVPFYIFAIRKMGWRFTLKTAMAVTLLSGFNLAQPCFIKFSYLDEAFASVLGAAVMALGFIILFRHKASLGGLNILALYAQERLGIRAGKVLMVTDAIIVACSLGVIPLKSFFFSILGVVLINQIITMNHRTDRYIA